MADRNRLFYREQDFSCDHLMEEGFTFECFASGEDFPGQTSYQNARLQGHHSHGYHSGFRGRTFFNRWHQNQFGLHGRNLYNEAPYFTDNRELSEARSDDRYFNTHFSSENRRDNSSDQAKSVKRRPRKRRPKKNSTTDDTANNCENRVYFADNTDIQDSPSSPPAILLKSILDELININEPEEIGLRLKSKLDDIILCLNTKCVSIQQAAEVLQLIVKALKLEVIQYKETVFKEIVECHTLFNIYIKRIIFDKERLLETRFRDLENVLYLMKSLKSLGFNEPDMLDDLNRVFLLYAETVPQHVFNSYEELRTGNYMVIQENISSPSEMNSEDLIQTKHLDILKVEPDQEKMSKDIADNENDYDEDSKCSLFPNYLEITSYEPYVTESAELEACRDMTTYINHQIHRFHNDLLIFISSILQNKDQYKVHGMVSEVNLGKPSLTDEGITFPIVFKNPDLIFSSALNVKPGNLIFLCNESICYFGEVFAIHQQPTKVEVVIYSSVREYQENPCNWQLVPIPLNSHIYLETIRELRQFNNREFIFEDYILYFKECDSPASFGPNIDGSNRNILLNFDESHRSFAETCLTREFCTIRTPPETGMLEFMEEILHAFLKRENVWYSNTPILVLCSTKEVSCALFEKIKACDAISLDNEDALKSVVSSQENIRILMHRKKIAAEKKNIQAAWKLIDKANKSVMTTAELQDTIASFHMRNYFKENAKGNAVEAWLRYGVSFSSMEEKVGKDLDIETENLLVDELESDDQEKEFTFERHQESHNRQEKKVIHSHRKFVEKAYFQKMLSNAERYPDKDMSKIRNIFELNHEDRWKVYKVWADRTVEVQKKKAYISNKKLRDYSERMKNLQSEALVESLIHHKVVISTVEKILSLSGFTSILRPCILIMMEANQVSEASMLAVTPECVKQLILLGDDLLPPPACLSSFLMELNGTHVKPCFNLYPSVFQRLSENRNISCLSTVCKLTPEITSALTPYFYDDLSSSSNLEALSGIKNSVFFLNTTVQNSYTTGLALSKNIIVCFCKHLLVCGHDPKDLTILTVAKEPDEFQKVINSDCHSDIQVLTSFDFYPRRSKIIVLFVNSSCNNDLHWKNKLVTCISRSSCALFAFGPFSDVFDGKETQEFLKHLTSKGLLKSEIYLYCHNHPDTITQVLSSQTFKDTCQVSTGCSQLCDVRLNCGHQCPRTCHFTEPDHATVFCTKNCERAICDNGHKCPYRCCDNCPPCTILVEKKPSRCSHYVTVECCLLLDDYICNKLVLRKPTGCNHTDFVPCYQSALEPVCRKRCERTLPCGHRCSLLCYQLCSRLCNVTINKCFPCGHRAERSCHDRSGCRLICGKLIPDCKHLCVEKCTGHPENHKCDKCKSCCIL